MVVTIIRDNMGNLSKIFVTVRGSVDSKGQWKFLSGKTESGETPEEALIREIKEELNTDIEVGTPVHII